MLNPILNRNENHFLSNNYLNKIISIENKEEKINSLNSKNKTNFNAKVVSNYQTDYENIDKNYIKRIVGTRYREYKTSEGQKTFTKMIMPKIKRDKSSGNHKTKKIKYRTIENNNENRIGPIKVDLLFYDQLTKKNNFIYFKDIILKNKANQRILSRNVKKIYKTINIGTSD